MLETRAFAHSFFQPTVPQMSTAAREESGVSPASLALAAPTLTCTSFSKCQQRISYQELHRRRILPLTEVDDPSQVHGVHLLSCSFLGKSKKRWRRKRGGWRGIFESQCSCHGVSCTTRDCQRPLVNSGMFRVFAWIAHFFHWLETLLMKWLVLWGPSEEMIS